MELARILVLRSTTARSRVCDPPSAEEIIRPDDSPSCWSDRDTPVRLSTEAETMCAKEILDQEKKTDIRSAGAESLTGV